MNNILEVRNLKKSFGSFVAVDNISFSVKEGEILGFLGPNGAGKTTTLQMLLGILTPTHGEIEYFGKKLTTHSEEIHERINFSSTYTHLPWNLTVKENLTFISYLYNIHNRKKRLDKLTEIFRLHELWNKQMTALSAGQMTRVNIAKAMINFPKVLLLDEPTASLDPEVAGYIREFLRNQREQFQMTILITSHNMAEVEEMCDRVIFISRGKLIADDTPKNLAKTIEICHVELFVSKNMLEFKALADKKKYVYTLKEKRVLIDIKESEVANFLKQLTDRSIIYEEISIKKPSLEDYFLQTAKEGGNQ